MSVREMLRGNDERFRALAAGLGPDEWAHPSLCDEWSNHEVLAHLVIGYRVGRRSDDARNTAPRWLVRPRQHRDGMRARRKPAVPPNCSTSSRGWCTGPAGWAASSRHDCCWAITSPTNSTSCSHSTVRRRFLPRRLVAVLNTQVALPNPFVPAFRNSRGLRLRATDVDWAHGAEGPLVEGRAAELVSVLGNRPRMLPALRGDGVELLASRVSPRRTRRAG